MLLHGAVVAMETAQLALNPYQSFQMQLNADASSEKNIYNGPILMKLYQPVLGVQFFFETQYI